MSVREATLEDIPSLLPLMEKCHSASAYRAQPFCHDGAGAVCAALIDSEDGIILMNGEAFLALAVAPLHFDPSVKQCLEVGFYGPKGGELIAPALAWARSRGAVRFVICNEINARTKGMDRWYARHGFGPASITYERWL